MYQQRFDIPGTRHDFHVVRLWDQPEEVFWRSPGLFALAVLSGTEDRRRTLGEVAERIDRMADRREQSNVSAAILAGLVLEKNVIEQLLRQEIMQESVIYQEIKAEGIQQGKAEGMQEEGASLVLRLLRKRFGSVPLDLEQQIQGLSVSQLEDLGGALLDFTAPADLVDWLNRLDRI